MIIQLLVTIDNNFVIIFIFRQMCFNWSTDIPQQIVWSFLVVIRLTNEYDLELLRISGLRSMCLYF